MKITGNTHPGIVRLSNQDSFAYGELNAGECWAVVCDGMGGAKGGNVASRLAVKYVSRTFINGYRKKMPENSIKNLMENAVYNANYAVYSKTEDEEELSGMGTTVVAAIISDGILHVAHCGDSRAYVISESDISQVTKDHSIVQIMLDNGQITPEQAKEHPRKHIITRAIGVENKIDIEYSQVELSPTDIILLCTDGLTNYVDDQEIYNNVKNGSFDTIAERLINMANQNGGGDNITIVAIANDDEE